MKKKSNLLRPGVELIIPQIFARDPGAREMAIRQLSDFARDLGVLASPIAGAVVMAYLAETDRSATESQLHVLSDIYLFHSVPESVTQPVTNGLADGTCEEWEVEYIEAIVDVINSRSDDGPSNQKQ